LKTHWDLLHETPLDAHGHGGERAGAGAACSGQLQAHHQAINLNKLHVATISHKIRPYLVHATGRRVSPYLQDDTLLMLQFIAVLLLLNMPGTRTAAEPGA
jgi:hypothetical protein